MSDDPERKRESSTEAAAVFSANFSQILQTETRPAAERRLVRKLDFRLLPTVVIVYLMNYIDRAAITAARLQGLQADLRLSDVQYDLVIAILFASYCPAQVLSNMIINYITRPSIFIGACVVVWGLMSVLTGITKDFAGIMTCRVLVGLPEAAFSPGALYLLSSWYTREELTFRSAILATGLFVAGAFGSLWAAGVLGTMNGMMGVAAWRWLFFIEGAITIFIGFNVMWLLPDYPNNTWWLTPAERHLAQVRLAEDIGEADQDSKQASFFEGLKLALKDPKVLIFMVMHCCEVLGLSFDIFFPTLTATLGYSTVNTLLMAAPPWVFAAIATLVSARHADITGERFFHMTGWWWVLMVGYIVALSTMSTPGRYFSLFLMASGNCGAPLVLVWVANSIPRPPSKRSAAIGLVSGFGSVGNIIGSFVWPSRWSPKYHQSMVIAICSLVFASMLGYVVRVLLVRKNKQMEQEELDVMHGPERERIEEAAKLEGVSFDEAVRRRMGFRYLH